MLSVLLVLVLANAFLHEDESGLELNPVAAAAQRVEKIDGGRMSLYFVYSSPVAPATGRCQRRRRLQRKDPPQPHRHAVPEPGHR